MQFYIISLMVNRSGRETDKARGRNVYTTHLPIVFIFKKEYVIAIPANPYF